jgi:micrococcal nuclease
MPTARLLAAGGAAVAVALVLVAWGSSIPPVYRVGRVVDGDTLVLTNAERIRLVQIDSPELFSENECYGRQATETAKRLLPAGTRVHLIPEPATDPVDRYGRLLRYVVRADDDLNVNLRLVDLGAAAPYFYGGRRGRFAGRLEALARRAREKRIGLWGACPRARYDPTHALATG